MVASKGARNGTMAEGTVKVNNSSNSSSRCLRSKPINYTEEADDSNDETEFLSIPSKRVQRNSSRTNEDIVSGQQGDRHAGDKYSFNGSAQHGRNDKHPVHRTSAQHRHSSEYNYPSSRHPQASADVLPNKSKRALSHSRSRRSFGLYEDLSSCEDEDGIGALTSTSRHRSTSHDHHFSKRLRRSSRNRKTIYSTLNVSTIEHAAMMSDGLDPEEIPNNGNKVRQRQRGIKPELRDLLAAQGKGPEDLQDISQPDIYSSIKSRKRQRRPRKFFDEDDVAAPIQNDNDLYENSGEGEQEIDDQHDNDEDHENDEDDDEDDDDDVDDDDEDDDDEEAENEEPGDRRYSLRTKRAQPLRFAYEIKEQQRGQSSRGIFDHLPSSSARRRRRHSRNVNTKNPASPYQQKHRHTNSQGASSTTSSSDEADDDENKFERRKKKSMTKARNRCLPMNLTVNELAKHGLANERQKIGSSLADIDPMTVDKTVTFESVGGHKKHVRALKEMVVFPLLYPEVFQKFRINPPRGCLFYGPPGTGKTLMARALANECSSENRKVAFFMRKGADCLSKWVGESERQLRLLFDQAYQMRPSIIFFDEIDGLAPVRSSRQDQIHSSIVSTLLGLMDGLDNRGEVIVIGATNRIDSIDPALRRPGRFDREFSFPLPDKNARREILSIHTKQWSPPLSERLLDQLAEKTMGYCGADINTLCAESTLFALRRRYPQIYKTNDKLKLDIDSITIGVADFYKAIENIVPTAQRSDASPGQALHRSVHPLLYNSFVDAVTKLSKLFPTVQKKSKILSTLPPQATTATDAEDSSHETTDSDSDFDEDDVEEQNVLLPPNGLLVSPTLLPAMSSYAYRESTIHRPRFLLCGSRLDGQTTHLAPAILHDFEGIPVHVLDIPTLYGTSVRTAEEACAQVFREARRTAPSVIYLPNAPMWWESSSETVHYTFDSLLRNLPVHSPVLLLATADCPYKELSPSLSKFFNRRLREVFSMKSPTVEERTAFFAPIFLQFAIKPPVYKLKKKMRSTVKLDKAPLEEPKQLTEKEQEKLDKAEEATMRNLRLFLRDVLTRLARDRRFKEFLKPVNTEEVSDYMDVIDTPMDISTMMNKINQHRYSNVASFQMDVNLICSNALEYNPDRCDEDKSIRHSACTLKDIADAIIQAELDPNFEKLCNEVAESRRKRNADPLKFAPTNFVVPPKSHRASKPDEIEQSLCTYEESVESKSYELQTSKSLDNIHKKKRKRAGWASGVVKRYKKKARIEDDQEAEEDDNEPTENDENELENNNIDWNKRNEDISNRTVDIDDGVPDDVFGRVGPSGDALPVTKLQPRSDNSQSCPGVENSVGNNWDEIPISINAMYEEETVKVEHQPPPIDRPSEEDTTEHVEDTNEVSDSNSGCSHASSAHEKQVKEDTSAEVEMTTTAAVKDPIKEEQSPVEETLQPRPGSETESTPVVTIPPPPPLIADEQKLKNIFHYVVQTTSSMRVDQLQRLYSNLARRIYRHRHNYDKTQLTQELYAEVKSYMKRVLGADQANSS